jgi:hypothetical protein
MCSHCLFSVFDNSGTSCYHVVVCYRHQPCNKVITTCSRLVVCFHLCVDHSLDLLFLNTCRNFWAENGRTYHEDDDVDDDPVVIGNHGNKKRSSSTKVNWKTNGGESRDINTLVEVQLNKVSNL